MKRRIGLGTALALSTASFLIGAAGTFVLQTQSKLRVLQSVALAHELEATSLCANGLSLHQLTDHERMARLLEQRLDSAVREASALTDQGVRLLGPGPNLQDGVRRAAGYYARAGNREGERKAEDLLARLSK
jgi:hypothetical protein